MRSRGMAAGYLLDMLVRDPRRGHPVAVFGRAAGWWERRVYRDSAVAGAMFAAGAVLPAVGLGRLAERGGEAATAAVTWAVLGGTMLCREAEGVARALEDGDVELARELLPRLCGRDPSGLGEQEIARAVVESVAENTSDAVVGPLVWGALGGAAGLAGFRAVNTLDAMVGHRNARYRRFGAPAARLDDLAGWAPARLTALLAVAAAPLVGGNAGEAWRVWRRYGDRHPSPNAGQCEAAFAGALGVSLGGANVYGDREERRPSMGEGPPPRVADIRRAVRLSRAVGAGALAVAAL
ncbi:cobalamin biosynthesis protein [Nocardiopsis changdeensis]|uniref:Cobalamin biosynthesis protein CobD n=1 Tax=Nocardiopsis changdeensis TaxID=2831969 RepID=A0ABX8BQ31_9ACTN|nr:cobalamin biosynthesis protein [Nocardiopsis changdeensis]QYX34570.1 cobalamin biosynthesis protein [Nocardiopsis sp. MT53]